jgi:hypothetical protein
MRARDDDPADLDHPDWSSGSGSAIRCGAQGRSTLSHRLDFLPERLDVCMAALTVEIRCASDDG